MSLREALKMLRLELGMTQEDLAKRINRAFVTVNRWENGKGFPSRRNATEILEMAEQYGASEQCISYLKDMLLIDKKRGRSAKSYGFPNIDREFLFQLADGSDNALYVIDAETYNLLYANRKAERLAEGHLKKNGKGNVERNLADEKDRRCYHFFAGQNKVCPFCPISGLSLEPGQDKVITIQLADRAYYTHVKCSEMKGRKIFTIYLTDITSENTERAALYRLTNDIPSAVGIYQVFLDGRIELAFMNEKLYKLIGDERKEQLLKTGKTDLCLIHRDDRPKLIEEIKTSISEKRDILIYMRMRVAPNTYHTMLLNARMIKKGHEKFTYYCMFHDLNNTAKNEENKYESF